MRFFLNHIYSIWKLYFWRFPEMFCHQQKVVDHQSDQAKNENFRFWSIFVFFKKLFFWAEMIFLRSEIQYYESTLSENSISEVFQRCSVTQKNCGPPKWPSKKWKCQLWVNFWFFSNMFKLFIFWAEMIFLRSEIQYYESTLSENSISERKSRARTKPAIRLGGIPSIIKSII